MAWRFAALPQVVSQAALGLPAVHELSSWRIALVRFPASKPLGASFFDYICFCNHTAMLKVIFNLFKARFLELAQAETIKPVHEGMIYAFTFQGKKWYTWDDLNLVPIARYGQFNRFMMELQNVISRDEIKLICQALEAAVEKLAEGKKARGISEITAVVKEINARHELLYHEEIWFRLASCILVAEDENPGVWNEDYEAHKANQFKANVEQFGGLHAFFTQRGWSEYIPSFEKLTSGFDELAKQQQEELKALLNVCESIARSDSQSTSTSSSSETN